MVKTGPLTFGLYLLGTLMLPVGTFDRYRGRTDDWLFVVGTGLAFDTPWNRGVILGACAIVAACIVGAIRIMSQLATGASKRRSILSHLCPWDACVVAWIAVPTVIGFFNPSPIADDLWQSVYLAIAWGGPYLAARVTVRTFEDAKACLWLVVWFGACSSIPAILELIFGRFVYGRLYGYHPNQSIGEFKFFGTRPLLCFEDPNQIAMWWLTVAMAAIILVLAWSLNTRDARIKWAVFSLPFLFQGVGASLLTIVGVVLYSMQSFVRWKTVLIALAIVASVAFLARGPLLRIGRDVAQKAGFEEQIKAALQDTPIGSLAWRMVREEEGSKTVESHLLFGWGTIFFWVGDGVKFRPWGFISLVNGAYGLVGSAITIIWFAMPIATYAFNRSRKRVDIVSHAKDPESQGKLTISTTFTGRGCVDALGGGANAKNRLGFGLALMWGLHGVDALVNPAFFLPMVFLFGAMPSLKSEECF